MKRLHNQSRISDTVQKLSGQLLNLADATWQQLKEQPEVVQEVAKDPFTEGEKAHAATAEILIFLLHACDRVASGAFQAALAVQLASSLRQSFMGALIGMTLPAFARKACPEEDPEEQQATQADLVHLYNIRATQYGFFPLGKNESGTGPAPLFTLVGIRLAEVIDCADNADVITGAVETVVTSLTAMREKLSLRETIGQIMAGGYEHSTK